MFKPVEPTRLSDAAVKQIVQAIGSGALQIGDRIPSERELMRQLGVGRASVREALRQLETLGVIEVRAGQGSVVVNTMVQAPASQLWKRWLESHSQEVAELMEVREALEVKAAELAAEHAEESHIETLRAVVARLGGTLPDGSPEVRAESDVEFHTTLAQAGGNQLLFTLAQSLMYALHEARVAAYSDSERSFLSLREHIAIMEAVAGHDPEQAKAAMTHHLRTSKGFLANENHRY